MFQESELDREVFVFPRPTVIQKLPKSFCREMFIDRVPEEISCGICTKVNLKPFFCSLCLTTFCKKCINKARGHTMAFLNASDITCPSCYNNSIEETSKTFRERIKNLQIKCQLCSKAMPLKEVKAHIENCPNSIVLCSNRACNNKGFRKDYFSFFYNPPWIDGEDFQTEYLTCSKRCNYVLEFEICLVDDKSRALELYRNFLLNDL